MRPLSPTPRQGFTLIELLVVISVIAILATLLFPAIGMVRTMANKAKDGNNVKQIVTMMFGYVQENSSRLPYKTSSSTAIAAGDAALAETTASFEILAAWSKGELPAKIFKGPTAANADLPEDTPVAAGTAWANKKLSYAYDWSAPGENALKTSRPLVASRDPDYWTGSGVNVAFGDAHYEFVKVDGDNATATNETYGDGGAATIGYVLVTDNKNGDNGDNIFSSTNDNTRPTVDMLKTARGSATRAYMK